MAKSGELILYASSDRQVGVLRDPIRDTTSDRQPLQVFFKWGNFVELTDEEKARLANA